MPIDTAQACLSIAPEELEGAALLALGLVAGGMATRVSPISAVIDPSGGTTGYVPPDKGTTGPMMSG
ncbi:MAG: hypothetical protein IRY87_07690 [Acetobacteraceae bacterium]|nr:hypothetical protein [Acetobacteraceae bacterium]